MIEIGEKTGNVSRIYVRTAKNDLLYAGSINHKLKTLNLLEAIPLTLEDLKTIISELDTPHQLDLFEQETP